MAYTCKVLATPLLVPAYTVVCVLYGNPLQNLDCLDFSSSACESLFCESLHVISITQATAISGLFVSPLFSGLLEGWHVQGCVFYFSKDSSV